jgi:hypothetical protein
VVPAGQPQAPLTGTKPPVQLSTAATHDLPSGESVWPAPQFGTHWSCAPPPEACVPVGHVQVLPTSVEPPRHVMPDGELGVAAAGGGAGLVTGLPSAPTHCSGEPPKACVPAGQVQTLFTIVDPPWQVTPLIWFPFASTATHRSLPSSAAA